MILFLPRSIIFSGQSKQLQMQLIFRWQTRDQPNSFSSTRYSAAVLPLVGRYQIAAAGLAQFNQTNFEDWR